MIDQPATKPFLLAIRQLLATDKLVLYGRIDAVPDAEMQAVLVLLERHFEQEAIGYPGTAPKWDARAAAWSAKVVFHAAQLLLYRSHEADALTHYFPAFARPKTPAAILSADRCLRYLPGILLQLEAIDVEDDLIPILKEVLCQWHYSGLLAGLPFDAVDLRTVLENECLAQLYVDRVIKTKNRAMAKRPELQGSVRAALGDYAEVYWKALTSPL